MVHSFPALLAWLETEGVLVLEGTAGARLPEHEIRLPAGWREAADEIQAVFDAAGFQPPWPGAFTYPRHIVVSPATSSAAWRRPPRASRSAASATPRARRAR